MTRRTHQIITVNFPNPSISKKQCIVATMAIVPRTKLSQPLREVQTKALRSPPPSQPRRRISNSAITTTRTQGGIHAVKIEPSDYDVVLSRAHQTIGNAGRRRTPPPTPMHKRKGNLIYLALMKNNMKSYLKHQESKKYQYLLAQSIVETIMSQPGKFLWFDHRNNTLVEMKKTSAIKVTMEGFGLLCCRANRKNAKRTSE